MTVLTVEAPPVRPLVEEDPPGPEAPKLDDPNGLLPGITVRPEIEPSGFILSRRHSLEFVMGSFHFLRRNRVLLVLSNASSVIG